MATYKVVETFLSINGEGRKAGQLATFVRMKGCNLNCAYCDTKWANEADASFTEMTKEEIKAVVVANGAKNVTLTGGEPLLREGIDELLEELLTIPGLTIEIETNGSVDVRPYLIYGDRVTMTLDYKLGASEMEHLMFEPNFDAVRECDTVKFVSGSIKDLERAVEVMNTHSLIGRCGCYLSPVFGSITPADMVEFMKDKMLNGVNLQIQMHKVIWDPEEKGV
ncbi:MAG: putative 7-carboxy-7-deazaguanine synthase QueE [Lachnospiraceae bacterium]|nr:putative 7-carboxy-7-deazaguanine synthase QueE [Lachnospiraceae bacterium]